MADIFDSISTDNSLQKEDIFDQVQSDTKWGFEHPYLKTLKDTYEQGIVNPLVTVANGMSPVVNGISKGFGFPEDQKAQPMQAPDMSNAPMAAKVLGDLAGGVTKGVAASVAGAGNPLLGYGALSGLEAYGKGEAPIPAAVSGAVSAIPQAIAGKVGSSLASAAAKPFGGMVSRYAPNVGTALGMGSASAATAPEGEKLRAGITGGSFGLMSPMNPIGGVKEITPEQHDELLNKGADIYRDILNPGKGIIKKVEIGSGKDINDSMKLAAKEGLIINHDSTGKLDTRGAIEQLQNTVFPMYEQQNKILESNPDKQFNLEDLGTIVKDQLKDKIKSGSDLAQSQSKVDNEIDAEILRHGNNVDAKTLNMIKQGMWSKSYNPLEPNANDTARQIGYAAKSAIEESFSNETIKENNSKIGDYLTLQKILEATHGQIVQGGKIGKYLAKGTGAIVGGAVGSHLPLLGEVIGPIAGMEAGGKVNEFINNPTRLTTNWANKIKSVRVNNPEVNSSSSNAITPENINPMKALPAPLPDYLKQRQEMPISSMGVKGGEYPSNNPLVTPNSIKGLPVPLPSYLQERENIPSINIPKGNAEPSNPIEIPKTSRRNSARYNKGATFDVRPDATINPLNPINQAQGGTMGGTNNPSSINPAVKALGLAGAIGIGSMLNPVNSQAAQPVKEPERLQLPSAQYTMKEEGFRGMPYIDTKGIKHVGYGFNMNGIAAPYIPQAVKDGKRAMTQQEGQDIFNKVYPMAIVRAQKFAGDGWVKMNDGQRKALVDMSYNMQGGLSGFKNLKSAIENGNFNTAAREILNSKYGRIDAPNRAKRNATLIQMK